MADIDVTFASNAGTVAREVDHAAAATTRAGAAAGKMGQAAKGQAAELNRAAAAARVYGDAAAVAEKKHVSLAKAAKIAGIGHAFKESSFIGGAAGGGAAGAAALGVIAGGMWMRIFEESVQNSSRRLASLAETAKELSDINAKAAETQAKAGMDAAKEYGPLLTNIVALGGDLKKLAEDTSKTGFALSDAYKAVLDAHRLFPGNERKAVGAAAKAATVDGGSLDQNINNMEGMPTSSLNNVNAVVAALVSISRGYLTGEEEVAKELKRIADSPLMQSLHSFAVEGAKKDIANVSNIPLAPSGAAADASAAANPLADAMRKQYIVLQGIKDANEKTLASMSGWAQFWDNVFNHGDSQYNKTLEATKKLGDFGNFPSTPPVREDPSDLATP